MILFFICFVALNFVEQVALLVVLSFVNENHKMFYDKLRMVLTLCS